MATTIQSVGEMLRTVTTNNTNFLTQVADHIEKLEARVYELEQQLEEQCKDENM